MYAVRKAAEDNRAKVCRPEKTQDIDNDDDDDDHDNDNDEYDRERSRTC